MKVALVGYGKMGKAIEEILIAKGHTISYKITSDNASDIQLISVDNTDVAIEFSSPEIGYDNVTTLISQGIKVVSGTTGWQDRLPLAEERCMQQNGALIWASNFSIGVNIFFKINQRLAAMMHHYDDYIPSMEEIHHTAKKDAPSGTAISIAEDIIDTYKRLQGWKLQDNQPDNRLAINAIRRDPEPGTHTVKYESDIDTISISHIAKSRKGFAIGAVAAAEYLYDKVGIYTMDDVLFL